MLPTYDPSRACNPHFWQVLERLNSVLDPSRLLVLPEKGNELEEVTAAPGFRLLATMNPGGDFGKKELSPALRNRFTEVWVPAVAAKAELLQLLHARLCDAARTDDEWDMGEAMLAFVEHLGAYGGGAGGGAPPSLRDLTAWVDFVNATVATLGPSIAFVHGACLVFVDGIGLQVSASSAERRARRRGCLTQLEQLLKPGTASSSADLFIGADSVPDLPPEAHPAVELAPQAGGDPSAPSVPTGRFGLTPFYVPLGGAVPSEAHFSLRAPTTRANAFRALRAMQLRKPVLLEGSPGVGKTSLVQALGAACGQTVVRINLSEQSDLMELLGADLPVEGAQAGTYAWQDGAFLSAMRNGHWVILDELNLAPQSVLEGLNACLDHRASVYIPELGASFECAPGFRVFGCQNPLQQGGGRKGLPKSFLNRFTQVWMEELDHSDMLLIISSQFGAIDCEVLTKMVAFVRALQALVVTRRFGGGPWDFNLRDVFRWCELMMKEQVAPHWRPWQFVDSLFLQRMRADADRQAVLELYAATVGDVSASSLPQLQPHYLVSRKAVQVGHVWLPRTGTVQPAEGDARARHQLVLPAQLRPLQALMSCVRMDWMAVLCGEAGSGKTSLLRMLSRLTGHRLQEVVLSTATDTTELLGCFEQSEPSRIVLDALSTAATLVSSTSARLLATGARAMQGEAKAGGGASEAWSRCMDTVTQLQAAWEPLAALGIGEDGGLFGDHGWGVEHATQLERVLGHLDGAGALLTTTGEAAEEEEATDASGIGEQVAEVRAQMAKAQKLRASGVRGRFVWVDGPLVMAMQRGDWLVLDNANLCNPSVLDRLNPLLERGGKLQLPECGLQPDGSVRELQAHPAFRLMLCIDPSHGELSRAMRNRGVEIAIAAPRASSREVVSMLCLGWEHNHVSPGAPQPSSALQLAMASAHEELMRGDRGRVHHSTALLQWSDTTVKRLQRGVPLVQALQEAATVAYGSTTSLQAQGSLLQLCERCAEATAEEWSGASVALRLDVPAAQASWPVTVGSSEYPTDALAATVACQAAFLCQLTTLLCSGSALPVELDGDRLQYAISTAALDFAMRASDADAPLRTDLYERLTTELTAAMGANAPLHARLVLVAIECGARFVRTMQAHPLKLAAQEALHAACAGNAELRELCLTSSCDLQRANPPLYERVRRHAASFSAPDAMIIEAGAETAACSSTQLHDSSEMQTETASPATAAWAQYNAMLPRLRMLQLIESEWLYEHMRLEHAAATTQPFDMPLLQRSFAQQPNAALASAEHDGRTESDVAVWAALVTPLYPCLSAVHDAVVEWLQLPVSDASAQCERLQALGGVWFALRALWRHCAEPSSGGNAEEGFERQMFLVLWRALHKRLGRLVAPPSPLAMPLPVREACDRVSRAAGFDASHFSAVLWKKGGHPAAPRTIAQLVATAELRELAAALRLPQGSSGLTMLVEEPTNAALWADAPLRKGLMMAACTIHSCGEFSRGEASHAAERLHEIPAALQLQLAERSKKAEAAVATGELPLELHITAQLWPLADLRSARQESGLLNVLASLAWSSATAQNGLHASLPHDALVAQAEAFAELVTAKSSRSPLDAAAAQTLAWRLLAAHGPSAALLPTDGGWLAGTMQQLSRGWHQHLWQGSFSLADESVVEVWHGPVMLLLCTETPLICDRLQRTETVALARRSAALTLLYELREALDQRAGAPADATSDWRRALHTLCVTLLAFRSTLPLVDQPGLEEVLRKLYACCDTVMSVATAMAARGRLPVEAVSAAGESVASLPPLLEACKGLLLRSNSGVLHGALTLLVWPALDEFCRAVERMATSLRAARACPPLHNARGRVWVLLGLLRWRLLLPEHPVDPTCKHGLKAEVLSARVAKREMELRASELVQHAWNGADRTADLLERRTELSMLRAAKLSAEERICVRPAAQDGPTFSQLHAELWQWERSLGEHGALLKLSAELGEGKRSAGAREAVWQQSSGQFLERLAHTFGAFDDFVTPIQLCVYEVKHGLRLQAAACASTAVAAEDGAASGADAGVAYATARTLLAFPQRPKPSSSLADGASTGESLPRSLAMLLQPLPALAAPPHPSKGRSAGDSLQQWRVSQQTSLAVLALRRLYVMVLLDGSTRRQHVHMLSRIMSAFVQTQVDVEAAEAERLEKEASLYKHKARDCGSAGGDVVKEEAAALKALFPDFAEEFADLVARPDAGFGMDDDDDVEQKSGGEEAITEAPVEAEAPPTEPLHVEPELILKMLTYHERVFSSAPEASVATADGGAAGGGVGGVRIGGNGRAGGGDKAPRGSKAAARAAAERRRVEQEALAIAEASDRAFERESWCLREARTEALSALQLSHRTAAQLLPSMAALLPASLDEDAVAAHLVLTSRTWQHLKGHVDASPGDGSKDATPDFFRDEVQAETARLEPILTALTTRVRELLGEWSEHAGLQLLLQVCERLRSFRTGAALMKFAIGTELLIKHCWEWESVACRATSIKEHIDALTALVLRWRKMELQAWPLLLQRVAEREHEAALVKVWVRLFKVMNASLFSKSAKDAAAAKDGDAGESRAGKGAGEEEAGAHAEATAADEKAHLQGVVVALDTLMQSAEGGAFDAYLRMLRSFERQMEAEEGVDLELDAAGDPHAAISQGRKRSYRSILHNVSAYYAQFSAPLERAIGVQKGELDAKLMDFVKLSQWSDRNPAALKTSVERSHAQLNRCVNQYQTLLRQTASGLLSSSNDSDDAAAEETPSKDGNEYVSLAPGEQRTATALMQLSSSSSSSSSSRTTTSASTMPAILLECWEASAEVRAAAAAGSPATPLHSARLPALCDRMRQIHEQDVLCARAATRSAKRREFVDGLREGIVSRSAELKKLETRKARQPKHKAVVDLLKELQAVGLSFHRTAADPRQESSADLFLVESARLDFSAAFPSQGAAHEIAAATLGTRWQQSWLRSEQLFFRSYFKLTQLRVARSKAHQDLSSREVSKAAGFAEHGFALLLSQRETIQQALTQCAALQRHLEQLRSIDIADAGVAGTGRAGSDAPLALLPPQQQLLERLQRAHEALGQILHVCVETSVLFDELVAMPSAGDSGLIATAQALQRCCRGIQSARRLLPEVPRSAAASGDAQRVGPLLTSEHQLALAQSYKQVNALRVEINAAASKLTSSKLRLLEPLTEQLDAFSASAASPLVRDDALGAPASTSDGADAALPLVNAIEQAAVQLMLATQTSRQLYATSRAVGSSAAQAGASEKANGEDGEARPACEHILSEHECLKKLLATARSEQLGKALCQVELQLRELAGRGSSSSGQHELLATAQSHAAQLYPALSMHLAALRWALHQAVEYHGALVRLELVCQRRARARALSFMHAYV